MSEAGEDLAGTMPETTAPNSAIDALREQAEELRLIVESARDYAIFTVDSDNIIVNWLPGAEAVFGWSTDEAEGKSGAILYTEDDRRRGQPEREIATARAEGKAPDVRWHVRKDGRLVFIEGEVVPLRDANQGIRGFLKIGRDATARRAAEDALRDSEERLRQFGEASSDILWMRDAQTMSWIYLTKAFDTIYGIPREEALKGDNFANWQAMIVPEDRARALDSIARVRGGERVEFEYRIQRPADGDIRWLRDTDFPILGVDGQVKIIGGIGQDVTALKRAQRHQQTLLAELQHRVRNTLAVVRSIARRTALNSSDIDEMVAHFDGRLNAFSRVQAVVTRNPEAGVDITSLIEDELVAHAVRQGKKLKISGPTIMADANTAERLSLAIHELATNAVKHGALATEAGRIAVRWRRVPGADSGDELHFEWIETGVDIEPDDERREGFGMELLRRSLPYDLQGETNVELRPTGVHFELRMPLSAANRRPGGADDRERIA